MDVGDLQAVYCVLIVMMIVTSVHGVKLEAGTGLTGEIVTVAVVAVRPPGTR